MQLQRLTTQLQAGATPSNKPVDIHKALHPAGMPVEVADAVLPQDFADKLNPPELQPAVVAVSRLKTDVAAALNPFHQPAPTPAPLQAIDFASQLNPPELQPSPGPGLRREPVNIRQILDSPYGRLAENQTGSLTYLD